MDNVDRDVRVLSSEVDLFREAERILVGVLPAGWFVSGELTEGLRGGPDAELVLRAPSNELTTFRVEVKMNPKRRDLTSLLGLTRTPPEPDDLGNVLLVSRFLSPSLREELREKKISYVDATGNVFINTTDPVVLIRQDGAMSDPWRGPGRPVGTLKGLPAAVLVRALADYRPPYKAAELAALAGASMGATYRLVEHLDQEALIDRDGARIESVDWANLLRRWSQDTGSLASNITGRGYLEPRGLGEARNKLRSTDPGRYAVTGSIAAEPYAPYAETRLATIYTNKPEKLAEDLGWRLVDSGANIIIAAPRSPVVFERTTTTDGIRLVAPSQAAADLLSGSGRQPAEGEALLEWMGRHENDWRR